jgi:sporulation protein YlmC with PRC-barrel domain
MTSRAGRSACCLVLAGLSCSAVAKEGPAVTAQGGAAAPPTLVGQLSSLNADALYKGWRARQLVGNAVKAKDGREVGAVRDIIIDADGRVTAVVVEAHGPARLSEALYRIPWAEIDLTQGEKGVVADLSDEIRPEHGLFHGAPGVPILPREFRIGEVVGDYARLKTGYGYGVVTDAVFTQDGRVMAVLVGRDAVAGGGTFAFAFHGDTGPWDAAMSYFGLPFITEDQARAAALRVDMSRFATGWM